MLAETTLTVAAEAVFAYLLEQSQMGTKIRNWLKGEPKKIAFQLALAQTYSKFDAKYPEWTASFFDRHFLTHRVAPLLARCIPPHSQPEAQEFVEEWAKQFGIFDTKTNADELTPVVEELLSWLKLELRSSDEFRPLFDSAALDTIEVSSVQVVASISMLQENLKKILYEISKSNLDRFTSGVALLSTDYSSRIENFLAEYLGLPNQPVPFGGRSLELSLLNEWLSKPDSPPYLLLTAPAGRGKSAVLVNWSQHLLTRQDLHTVFIPVSIRFRTNLSSVIFSTIAAQLAHIHGESVSNNIDTSSEIWRGLVSDYLRRPSKDKKPIVVVLDGVDEAADWRPGADLFPTVVPQGLRVVVSARHTAEAPTPRAWLEQLGWNRPNFACNIELGPLNRHGIAEVLSEMGFPLEQLSRRTDILNELFRLTEGDPLLVRLYTDDLWTIGNQVARLRPEELEKINPGLEGYFKRWWSDQRTLWGANAPLLELNVQAILGLLACALGPLYRETILNSAPPNSHLNEWTLEDALLPIARFVIGDGKEHGYTFTHPRLSVFFYKKMRSNIRQEVELRLLNFGRKQINDLLHCEITPADTDRYILQYYGAHLENSSGHPDDFIPLTSNEWRQAWEELEGNYSGFLTDVSRAWNALSTNNAKAASVFENIPYIGQEIRCALITSSVNSLAKNITPKLVTRLLQLDSWNPAQALSYATLIPAADRRASVLTALLPYITLVQMRSDCIDAANAAIGSIEDIVVRLSVSAQLLPYVSCQEATRTIDLTISKIKDITEIGQRIEILKELLACSVDIDKILNQILEEIRKIKDADDTARILVDLTRWFAGFDTEPSFEPPFYELIEIARDIEFDDIRIQTLTKLTHHLPEKFRATVLDEILTRLHMLPSDTILDRNPRLDILEYLPSVLTSVQSSKAINAAEDIDDLDDRVIALSLISSQLNPEKTSYIYSQVLLISGQYDRIFALSAILPCLPPSTATEAQKLIISGIEQISSEKSRVDLLFRIAPFLSRDSMEKVLDVVDRTLDDRHKSHIIIGIASYCFLLKLVEKAFHIARDIESQDDRLRALDGLVPYISGRYLWDALLIYRKISDDLFQVKTLIAQADYLPMEFLERINSKVSELDDAYDQASSLINLSPHLHSTFQYKNLSQALTLIASLPDMSKRNIRTKKTELLARIIPILPVELLQDAWYITQTLPTVHHSHDERLIYPRATVQVYLVTSLVKAEFWEYALTIFSLIGPKKFREIAISQLVVVEHSDVERYIKYWATNFDSLSSSLDMMIDLIPFLQREFRDSAQRFTLELAHQIEDPSERATAYTKLVKILPPQSTHVVVELTLLSLIDIVDESQKVLLLAEIAPRVDEQLHSLMLTVIESIEQSTTRLNALAEILPFLSGDVREYACEMLIMFFRGISIDEKGNLRPIHSLIQSQECLSDSWQKRVQQEILRIIHNLHESGALGRYFETDEVLEMLVEFLDVSRNNLLEDDIRRITEYVINSITDIQRDAEDVYKDCFRLQYIGNHLTKVTRYLAGYLSVEEIDSLWDWVTSGCDFTPVDYSSWAIYLAESLQYLPNRFHDCVVFWIFNLAESVGELYHDDAFSITIVADTYIRIAHHLSFDYSESLINSAGTALNSIDDPELWIPIFVDLTSQFPELNTIDLQRSALRIAAHLFYSYEYRNISDSEILLELFEYLISLGEDNVRLLASEIENEQWGELIGAAITSMTSHKGTSSEKKEADDCSSWSNSADSKLSKPEQQLPTNRLEGIVTKIQQIPDDKIRADTFAETILDLVTESEGENLANLVYPLWHSILVCQGESTRPSLLSFLEKSVELNMMIGTTTAIEELTTAILEIGDWWP